MDQLLAAFLVGLAYERKSGEIVIPVPPREVDGVEFDIQVQGVGQEGGRAEAVKLTVMQKVKKPVLFGV